MLTGAETPLVSTILAGAQSGQGGAVFNSGQNTTSRFQPSVPHRDEPDASDLVDISSEVRGRLENNTYHDAPPAPDALNLKRVIEEFEKSLDDENRIPPSIFNQMRKLLEAALQGDNKPTVDTTA